MQPAYAHFWLDPKFWIAISFLLFFLLLGRKLWSIAMGALDARGAKVRADLAEAARLRAEAEAMRAQAEADRQAAIAEAAMLMERTRKDAERYAAASAAEAALTASRRERMAMDRIAAAEASAIAAVRNAAAEVATAAVRQVVEQALTPDAAGAMVDAAIADLPRALRAA